MEEKQTFYEELVTRAASYKRPVIELDSGSPQPSIKRSKRNSSFLKSKEHFWKPENSSYQSCFILNLSDSLPNGVLPTRKSILEYLMYLKEEESVKGQTKTHGSPEWLLSKDIALHWIFCNVYPVNVQCIQQKVYTLWAEFKSIINYDNKKKREKYWFDYEMFVSQLNQTFDFKAEEGSTKIQEKQWGCKMSDNDRDFYELQRQNPPTEYCLTFVDKKWQKSKDRQESRLNRSNCEYYEF